MDNVINCKVSLGKNSYTIFIGKDILDSINNYIPNSSNYSKRILVTDINVHKKNLRLFNKILKEHFEFELIILPQGEKIKSFKYLQFLIEKILKFGIDRDTLLICIGGGVLGDLSALASSIVLRGIDLIQIPSTLLSQVDSSVGGKTGINSKYGKNLIGSFKQPKSVIISTDILRTLGKRELISGYAEILKYSFIKDKKFFFWLLKNGEKVISLDSDSCIYAINKSCSIKSKIVSIDEKEKGIREILNFGHTFGHAIELSTGFKNKIKHGEAIFIGMYLAIKFSIKLKLCNKNILINYKLHLDNLGIKFKLSHYKIRISPEKFLQHMKFDKKVKKDKIKLILLKDIGTAVSIFLDNEKKLSNFLKDELK
tara:strand:+ start:235 stop:1341 length:1107 start_codon:yes stop_codon:yes gene_type:complete